MPDQTLDLFLQLRREGDRVCGSCWQEDDQQPPGELEEMRLAPDDTVSIPAVDPPHDPQPYTLQELVDVLIEFNAADLHAIFEERGQITLGKYLWDQTLGRLDRWAAAKDIHLRILTDDEHLASLPWPLMMRGAAFLTSEGWAISLLTRPGKLTPTELPPSPRLLMVAPEPTGVGATRWDDHRRELLRMLEEGGPQLAKEDNFCCVHTWQQFRTTLRDGKWDAVYYYGHGDGDRNQSRLVFEDEGGHKVLKAMSDGADELRRAAGKPKILYVNCCLGDAGGLAGAGRQLSDIAPCVLTNRTVATVAAARAQAQAFWRNVLLEGMKPHHAIARNYQQLGDIGLDRIKPYWFTPVFYANYSEWLSHPPRKMGRREYDPHWKVKLDRIDQFGRVTLMVREMLIDHKPRTLAFVWYGQQGQGMSHFHERLEVDLPQHIDDADVMVYRPAWPDHDETTPSLAERGYEEKLWEAFRVDSVDRICARVRSDAGSGRVVVVLNLPHVMRKEDMDPKRLTKYIQWWDRHVAPRLEDRQHWFVLGFSFQAADCLKFQRALDRQGLRRAELTHTVVTPLQPLECVARDDLIDFIRRHSIYVPQDWLDHYLDYVLRKTEGRYEATLRELEQAVIDGYAQWQQSQEQPAEADDEEDDTGIE